MWWVGGGGGPGHYTVISWDSHPSPSHLTTWQYWTFLSWNCASHGNRNLNCLIYRGSTWVVLPNFQLMVLQCQVKGCIGKSFPFPFLHISTFHSNLFPFLFTYLFFHFHFCFHFYFHFYPYLYLYFQRFKRYLIKPSPWSCWTPLGCYCCHPPGRFFAEWVERGSY